MRRAAVLLVLALALAGCANKPINGNTPGPDVGGPPPAAGGPAGGEIVAIYEVEVRVKDIELQPARRNLVCTITGLSAGKVIRIRDDRTGQDQEYRIVIDDITFKSPQILQLQVYATLTHIRVRCGALGAIGDTLLCEPRDEVGNIARLTLDISRVFDHATRGHMNMYCDMEIIVVA